MPKHTLTWIAALHNVNLRTRAFRVLHPVTIGKQQVRLRPSSDSVVFASAPITIGVERRRRIEEWRRNERPGIRNTVERAPEAKLHPRRVAVHLNHPTDEQRCLNHLALINFLSQWFQPRCRGSSSRRSKAMTVACIFGKIQSTSPLAIAGMLHPVINIIGTEVREN